MSAYKVISCEITELSHLIAALEDMGLLKNEIEIHQDSVHLRGYRGDLRHEKANVIVRKGVVNKRFSAGQSNDIGFEEVEGKYVARISDYDLTWWKNKESRFKQVAAAESVIAKAKKKGYQITKKEVGGVIKLKLSRNY